MTRGKYLERTKQVASSLVLAKAELDRLGLHASARALDTAMQPLGYEIQEAIMARKYRDLKR